MGVTAGGGSYTQSYSIALRWNSVFEAAGYYVYRSLDTYGTFTLVGTTSSTSYTDSAVAANTTYYYTVSAFNSAGESPQSSYASAATGNAVGGSILSAPTGLTGSTSSISIIEYTIGQVTQPSQPMQPSQPISSTHTITLSWNSVSGATGYRVYRSLSASGTYSLVGTTSSASYTDSGVVGNTAYYYTVSAFNSTGESPQSSSITITTGG
jgi:fibronectin type 3 domain-containing protein